MACRRVALEGAAKQRQQIMRAWRGGRGNALSVLGERWAVGRHTYPQREGASLHHMLYCRLNKLNHSSVV